MMRQFTIRNLLVLVAIFSVASWLLTVNWHYAVLWISALFGIYVARRSDYPWFLMAICGLLMGILFVLSLVGLSAILTGYLPFATSLAEKNQALSMNARFLVLAFDGILWVATLMIFGWFVSVLRRASGQKPDAFQKSEI